MPSIVSFPGWLRECRWIQLLTVRFPCCCQVNEERSLSNLLQSLRTWRVPCIEFKIHHDDVIKWKHFPRNWPFVRGIRRSPVNSPHKGQWSGALMFSLICARINGWVNNSEAGNLIRYRATYDVIVMRSWMSDTDLHAISMYLKQTDSFNS